MANIKHTNKYSLSRLLNKKEKHNSENEKELKTSNKEAMKKYLLKNIIFTSGTMAEQIHPSRYTPKVLPGPKYI